MRKIIFTGVLVLLLVAMVGLAALANSRVGVRAEETVPRTTPRPEEAVSTEAPQPEETAVPEEEPALTIEDLAPFVRLEDVHVSVGSALPRLTEFSGVLFPEVVTSVSASTAQLIDTAAAGEYEILYTYTVDRQMYDIWLDALDRAEEIEIPEDQADGTLLLEETIPYEGLTPGGSYTMRLEYRVLEEGEDPALTFGTLLMGSDGTEFVQETAFVPEEAEGEITGSAELDISGLEEGQTLRRFVYFLPDEEEGTQHEEQTVEAVCRVYVDGDGTEAAPTAAPTATPAAGNNDQDSSSSRSGRSADTPTRTAAPSSTTTPASTTPTESEDDPAQTAQPGDDTDDSSGNTGGGEDTSGGGNSGGEDTSGGGNSGGNAGGGEEAAPIEPGPDFTEYEENNE